MHRRIPYLAFIAALAGVPAWAADGDERVPPAYRDDPQRWPPHAGKPLRFTAPPSQLRQPWRCDGGDVYARPPAYWPCAYDLRTASDFLLDYPFAPTRLMPPLRPVPPPLAADTPSKAPTSGDPPPPVFNP